MIEHPETQAGEFLLGNFTDADWKDIGWKTKRRGQKAFCLNGDAYPFQEDHKVAPGFAAISEDPQRAAEIVAEREKPAT